MEQIFEHFPNLSPKQQQQISMLGDLYKEWNERINVVSRKDIENLYIRHVLHSLAIAKLISFKPGTKVLDLGTGGGFPGIPLAILFPETQFLLIDGTRKKIKVVEEVSMAIGLTNVTARQQRVEEMKGRQFDFVVTRAVALLSKLVPWSMRLIKEDQKHGLPNGLIALKGGNIKEEIAELPGNDYTETTPIYDFFKNDFFKEKHVVYVQY